MACRGVDPGHGIGPAFCPVSSWNRQICGCFGYVWPMLWGNEPSLLFHGLQKRFFWVKLLWDPPRRAPPGVPVKSVYFKSSTTLQWYTMFLSCPEEMWMWERGWEGKHGQVWTIGRDGLGVRIMSPSAFENKLGKAVSTERDLSFYCTRWNWRQALSTERDSNTCFYPETHSWRSLKRRWGGEPDTMLIGKVRNSKPRKS